MPDSGLGGMDELAAAAEELAMDIDSDADEDRSLEATDHLAGAEHGSELPFANNRPVFANHNGLPEERDLRAANLKVSSHPSASKKSPNSQPERPPDGPIHVAGDGSCSLRDSRKHVPGDKALPCVPSRIGSGGVPDLKDTAHPGRARVPFSISSCCQLHSTGR
jgi:hypothetical protein